MKILLLIAFAACGVFTGCQYLSKGDINEKRPRALAVVSKDLSKGQAAYSSIGECSITVTHVANADGSTSGTATVNLTKDTANSLGNNFLSGLFGLLVGIFVK